MADAERYLDRVSEHWAIDEAKEAWQAFYCGKGHRFTCEICEQLVATPSMWMALKGKRVRCGKHISSE